MEDLVGTRTKNSKVANQSKNYFYNVTLRIERAEGKRLVSFNDANLNQSFDLKFFGRSIGVIDFVYPYESATPEYVEFTIHLLEHITDKVKDLLSQSSVKLTWE